MSWEFEDRRVLELDQCCGFFDQISSVSSVYLIEATSRLFLVTKRETIDEIVNLRKKINSNLLKTYGYQ